MVVGPPALEQHVECVGGKSVGLDDIDVLTHPHLALTDSRRNLSDLPSPTGRSSMHLLFDEGNATSHVLNATSAHLMTHGALLEADMGLNISLNPQWGQAKPSTAPLHPPIGRGTGGLRSGTARCGRNPWWAWTT